MSETNQKVVTRFAPSPTGFMHIGGVRTALYAWLWARKHHGTFILRIEDTDRDREVTGSIQHIMDTLRWLRLDWDYGPDTSTPFGPCIQSQRLETYRAAAQILIEKGYAYPDPYSAEEIDGFRRQAQAEKRVFLFRDHRPVHTLAWDGTRPLRFRVPTIERTRWHDAVRGDLEAGEEALDDFILIKSDGYPTYNFAHIIDDYHMGVTHIMRADEFISSTPKFIALYEALEITPPTFVTLPPILRDDKTKKLGKRDGAKDILLYRDEGFLPEAMINFLALIGWSPGTDQEIFMRDELINAFDINRIQRQGGAVNEDKLRWVNREHLIHMDDATFADYIAPVVSTHSHELMSIIRERISVRSDIDPHEYNWVYNAPHVDMSLLPGKGNDSATTDRHLKHVVVLLDTLSNDAWNSENIRSALWEYATQEGRAAVLWPIRYALTGLEKSPDPFTVASILGKDETIRRIISVSSSTHSSAKNVP